MLGWIKRVLFSTKNVEITEGAELPDFTLVAARVANAGLQDLQEAFPPHGVDSVVLIYLQLHVVLRCSFAQRLDKSLENF